MDCRCLFFVAYRMIPAEKGGEFIIQEHTGQSRSGCSACSLHWLAMGLMLCDHLWATLLPVELLNDLGRLAFPLFAFLLAEGFRHTRSQKRYLGRMLLWALISEIPFDLFYANTVFYPFHQNVLWTYLIALLLMTGLDRIHRQGCLLLTAAGWGFAILLGLLLGALLMADYYGPGVLTVLVFYAFGGRGPWDLAGQLACLYLLHAQLLGGYQISMQLGSLVLEFPQQGLALLALIPIRLYHGRQGPHPVWQKWVFYGFYPAHMLVLAVLWRMQSA